MNNLFERIKREIDRRERFAESMRGTGFEQSKHDIEMGQLLEGCKAALSQQDAVGEVVELNDGPIATLDKPLPVGALLYAAPPSTAQEDAPIDVVSYFAWAHETYPQFDVSTADGIYDLFSSMAGAIIALSGDSISGERLSQPTAQGVEEWIAANQRDINEDFPSVYAIEVSKIRAFLSSPPLEDGMVKVPVEPKITNEMKAQHIGEYTFEIEQTCSYCAVHHDEDDLECETCNGELTYSMEVTVPWDLTKRS